MITIFIKEKNVNKKYLKTVFDDVWCLFARLCEGRSMKVPLSCSSVALPGSVKVLMISSMGNNQETARWQFWRKIHLPLIRASKIIFSAIGPWPWPNEMDSTLWGWDTLALVIHQHGRNQMKSQRFPLSLFLTLSPPRHSDFQCSTFQGDRRNGDSSVFCQRALPNSSHWLLSYLSR